jgi:hypothetical protein
MSPENVQEAEQYGEQRSREYAGVGVELAAESRREVVAFKFGGTSLLGAERMLHSAGLVKQAARTSRVAVVVSAMKGVTDQLLALARLVDSARLSEAKRNADALLRLHADVLFALQLNELDHQRVWHDLRLLGRDLLHEVSSPAQAGTEAHHDSLASFGERFSARLFAASLDACDVPAVPVTSSEFVLTCNTFRGAKPDMEETRRRGRDVLQPLLESGLVPVVTGFVGATRDGRITTLGRNSSDYSGAIIAHVVDADELVIWTDVDGVYTANPNESSEARLLHQLSYEEAHALAAAGAKVLHAEVLPLAAETEMVFYYMKPGATEVVEAVFGMMPANGIGLSPDETTVYIAETPTARLWAYDISAPGTVKPRDVIYRGERGKPIAGLGGYQMFDSLAVEASGNVCVATLISGCISVIAPDGALVEQVPTGDRVTTNIAFGGPELKTAYITLSGKGELIAMDWARPGLPLNFLNK